MKISVIGMGYVGLTTAVCLADIGNEVVGVDSNIEKIKQINNGVIPFFEPQLGEILNRNINNNLNFIDDIEKAIKDSDIMFITVGTPISETGEVDTSQIYEVVQSIGKYINGYKVIVTKSTVPIGMNNKIINILKNEIKVQHNFDVVSNPEFLREGSAVVDMFNMDRVVIGSNCKKAIEIVQEIYKPFDTKFLITGFETAEMIKYASNAFLATKISFINEIANLCEKVNADVLSVAMGMGMDRRIGTEFLKAGVGYGGSCFHKDINALVNISKMVNADLEIAATAERVNNNQRKKIVQKIEKILENDVRDKTATILGITFKANTDDIRCAPSIDIIKMLKEMKMRIKVYDPIVNKEQLKELGDIVFCKNVYESLEGTDVAIVLTEWDEFKNIDWEKAKKIMNQKIIIDGRNIYSLNEIKEIIKLGYKYNGVGRNIV